MRSVQIIEWGKPLEAREYPTPEPRGTEVLVEVEACGVCHSDVHIWDGYFDLGGGQRVTLEQRGVGLPFTMGHEIAGRVARLGPDVTGVTVGQPCLVYPWLGCGTCPVCQRDDQLLCLTPRTLGTRRAGGYGSHVIVPHARYLVDYGGLPRELAATYTCSGITALSALRKTAASVGADDFLLVIGAGGVGGNALSIAPAVVRGRVVVADVDAQKREAAARAGAHAQVDNGRPGALAEVLEITGGGAAAAIDFVGRPETVGLGIDSLRKGGKLVIVGLYGGQLAISPLQFPFKMMTIEGSYVGTLGDLKELIRLAQAGKVPPLPIQTRPVTEATQALTDLRQGGRIVGRWVLRH
jgi:D-arabinose 1-dehydrogenase-like Zn-dependent alcohol dehydrogenase